MTDEQKNLRDGLIKLVVSCIFAYCYSLGGDGHLIVRRFIGPPILVSAMLWYSRDWRSLICLTSMGALTLGYGADVLWLKILKRFYCGLTAGITLSAANILNKQLILSVFQCVLAVSASIIFGAFNPFHDARIEELVIGFFYAFIPLMSAKRR